MIKRKFVSNLDLPLDLLRDNPLPCDFIDAIDLTLLLTSLLDQKVIDELLIKAKKEGKLITDDEDGLIRGIWKDNIQA